MAVQAHNWHTFTAEKVVALVSADTKQGLSTRESARRRQEDGRNELPRVAGFTLGRSLFKQLRSPLSLVLVGAAIVTLSLGEFVDAGVICVALLVNIAIGVFQEGKASRVFEKLAAVLETHTTVLRDGEKSVIPSSDVVVGDVLFLVGGAKVPADMRLFETSDLKINESALTGEWIPVEKHTGILQEHVVPAEQHNMVFAGTTVVSGTGMGIVIAIGANARFGAISESLGDISTKRTPLEKEIHRLTRTILLLLAGALATVLLLGWWRGEPFVELLLLSIAIAVAAMPEGLPAAISVTLAIGMERVLRAGGLVKNLLAAETLGSTTVVLTDKTGTLTEGKMTLSGLYTAESMETDVHLPEGDNREVLKMAVLASDAFVEEENGEEPVVQGRPIEKAIVEAGLAAGMSQTELFNHGSTRLDFLQFEASRRYALSLNEYDTREGAHASARLYFSGAPEHLLALSSSVYRGGKAIPLTDTLRQEFERVQKEISAQGMRFTAVAYIDTEEAHISEEYTHSESAKELVFGGLMVFADTVRADVPASMREVTSAGVRVIMATGDYKETAGAIAASAGIKNDGVVITGAELDGMSDDELYRALMKHSIFARVLPEQKLHLARVLQEHGEVVAMTGDGVNDAPALVAADIGIAVGSGTDVAKSAADVVLIENSFAVIVAAIREGRRIMENVRKIVAYLLSTSMGEIVLITGSFAVGGPLPILPAQILWANMVGEGLMSIPFAFEPASRTVMTRGPEQLSRRRILTKEVMWFSAGVSVLLGVLLIALYLFLLTIGEPVEKIHTIIFVALSIVTMFVSFSFKDLTQPLWRIPLLSNKPLLVALFGSAVTLGAVFAIPPLSTLLSLVPLAGWEITLLVMFGMGNLLIVEAAKYLLVRGKTAVTAR